jgi:hypothetical protein
LQETVRGDYVPTVQQLINKVDKRYPIPSSWNNDDVIDVFNDEMRHIFRELQLKTVYEFTTIADQPFYSMASDMEIEFIEYVGITSDTTVTADSYFREYEYEPDMNKTLCGYKYGSTPGGENLIIYPIPDTTGENAKVIYYKRPTLLSSLTETPELEEDWHMILVYAAIIEIAGSGDNPDIAIVNNYTRKYNDIMEQILQSRYERLPKYPRTKDVMKRGRYGRYYSRHLDIEIPED